MGTANLGAPADFIKQTADRFSVKYFVETGTYYGKTALWASSVFDRVITIECSSEIHQSNVQRYKDHGNISFLFGDSREVLEKVMPSLNEPAFFWLDGHWSGGETYGENDQCPLIDELTAINQSPYSHFVLIDDARLFTSPPPLPNRMDQWPSIDMVVEALQSGGQKRYIVIIEDVIIAVPYFAKDFVADYYQNVSTRAWERDGHRIIKMWEEYRQSSISPHPLKDSGRISSTMRNILKKTRRAFTILFGPFYRAFR